jgi:hypothetical protein
MAIKSFIEQAPSGSQGKHKYNEGKIDCIDKILNSQRIIIYFCISTIQHLSGVTQSFICLLTIHKFSVIFVPFWASKIDI